MTMKPKIRPGQLRRLVTFATQADMIESGEFKAPGAKLNYGASSVTVKAGTTRLAVINSLEDAQRLSGQWFHEIRLHKTIPADAARYLMELNRWPVSTEA